MGQTKVLCVATVEEKAPAWAEAQGIGWIHAEYAMLPRAGEERTSRGRASNGGRAQEISRLVGRSLRAAVDLKVLAPFGIVVDCDVIRADGGTRTASVNGGMVALAQALAALKRKGHLPVWPLRRFVGAVSIGLVAGRPVLDMAYADDRAADADLNLVMTDGGDVVEIQGTGERRAFTQGELKSLLRLGGKGIQTIVKEQKKTLRPLQAKSST